jgi:CheY-like chemotaxis protein
MRICTLYHLPVLGVKNTAAPVCKIILRAQTFGQMQNYFALSQPAERAAKLFCRLNLGLPDIDGVEVLKSIRQWSAQP